MQTVNDNRARGIMGKQIMPNPAQYSAQGFADYDDISIVVSLMITI